MEHLFQQSQIIHKISTFLNPSHRSEVTYSTKTGPWRLWLQGGVRIQLKHPRNCRRTPGSCRHRAHPHGLPWGYRSGRGGNPSFWNRSRESLEASPHSWGQMKSWLGEGQDHPLLLGWGRQPQAQTVRNILQLGNG